MSTFVPFVSLSTSPVMVQSVKVINGMMEIHSTLPTSGKKAAFKKEITKVITDKMIPRFPSEDFTDLLEYVQTGKVSEGSKYMDQTTSDLLSSLLSMEDIGTDDVTPDTDVVDVDTDTDTDVVS